MSTYYKPANLLTVGSSDVGWIIGVASAILALAWFGGFIRPQTTQPRSRPQPATSEGDAGPEDSKTLVETESISELDDIQLEVDVDDERISVEAEEMSDSLPEEPVHIETVEVIEVVEEEPTVTPKTASGRLASMREELGSNEGAQREGSIEDRMKEFFRDE